MFDLPGVVDTEYLLGPLLQPMEIVVCFSIAYPALTTLSLPEFKTKRMSSRWSLPPNCGSLFTFFPPSFLKMNLQKSSGKEQLRKDGHSSQDHLGTLILLATYHQHRITRRNREHKTPFDVRPVHTWVLHQQICNVGFQVDISGLLLLLSALLYLCKRCIPRGRIKSNYNGAEKFAI